jgi:putative transposase
MRQPGPQLWCDTSWSAVAPNGRVLAVLDACRKLGITEHTYDRWKKEYGGRRVEQAMRLKGLEQEHVRLKRIAADQAFDLSILKGVDSGNF